MSSSWWELVPNALVPAEVSSVDPRSSSSISQNCLGSLADVPQNLLDEVKHFEQIFTVDTAKLKQVSDHFVKELEKGGLSIAYQSGLHADQHSH